MRCTGKTVVSWAVWGVVYWLVAGSGVGCLRDLDVPLQNYSPHIVGEEIGLKNIAIFYPDSIVCTLTVADFNDSVLRVDSTMWKGTFRQLDFGLGTKRIVLGWPSPRLGCDSGMIVISDEHGARLEMPYRIERFFEERFLSRPLIYWVTHDDVDLAGYFRFLGGEEPQVVFFFPRDTTRTAPATILLRSKFALGGDFLWRIEYCIPPKEAAGYELLFSLTNTTDTSRYAGQRIDVSLLDQGEGFCIKYNDPFSFFGPRRADVALRGGPLRFVRMGNSVRVQLEKNNDTVEDITINASPFIFPFADSVYLQVRVTVNDFSYGHSIAVRRMIIEKGNVFL